jgi:tRNA(fMet)-specific endonuclease VapC
VRSTSLTAGYILLDTDVFSFLTKPDPIRAALYRPHVIGKTLAISFITVGKALFGARKRKWESKKISNLRLSLHNLVILPYDMALCEVYANLKAELYAMGRPMTDNDLWIAASALRHSIPLVSNNQAHFEGIPGLTLRTEKQA